jgi:protein-disulfide isomerase
MKKLFLPIIKACKNLMMPVILIGSVFFCSTCIAASPDQETAGLITSFGTGKIKVRLYSDYFCGPCRNSEPKIESVIKTLIKNNTINVTFIDVPFHPPKSVLYAKYFLYILNEKKEFNHALTARSVLFDAAKENIAEKDKIEGYLKNKNIKFKSFDEKQLFNIFENHMNGDGINTTPTCVIENNGRKEIFKGGDSILKSLEGLKL